MIYYARFITHLVPIRALLPLSAVAHGDNTGRGGLFVNQKVKTKGE